MTPDARCAHHPTQPAQWGFRHKLAGSSDRDAAVPAVRMHAGDWAHCWFRVSNTGLFFTTIKDPDVQTAAYRAPRLMADDMYRDMGDRATPAVCIPTHTPETALEEPDVAVTPLRATSVMFTRLLSCGVNRRHIKPLCNMAGTHRSNRSTWIAAAFPRRY